MSTRSRIGISQEDGSVKSIYCHYDGYPEGVGQTLIENYTSPVEVMNLIDKGDLVSLQSQEHFADRGESDVDAIVTPENEYVSHTGDCWGEYAYLYKDEEWLVQMVRNDDDFGFSKQFTPVQSAIDEYQEKIY
jgi:hypothetical protein